MNYRLADDIADCADRDESVVTVELEACEPDDVPALAARHHCTAHRISEGRAYWWPFYRYTGTLRNLAALVEDGYEDGSSVDGLAFVACNVAVAERLVTP